MRIFIIYLLLISFRTNAQTFEGSFCFESGKLDLNRHEGILVSIRISYPSAFLSIECLDKDPMFIYQEIWLDRFEIYDLVILEGLYRTYISKTGIFIIAEVELQETGTMVNHSLHDCTFEPCLEYPLFNQTSTGKTKRRTCKCSQRRSEHLRTGPL